MGLLQPWSSESRIYGEYLAASDDAESATLVVRAWWRTGRTDRCDASSKHMLLYVPRMGVECAIDIEEK